MKAPRITSLLFVALAAACGTDGSRGGPALSEIPLVWVDRDIVRTVDLGEFVEGTLEMTSTADLEARTEGHSVTLDPAPGFTGDVELAVTVRRGGEVLTGSLLVRVKDRTRRCETIFRWSGNAGTVAVAGEWNAFSTSADPMVEVAPGDWEAVLTLPAGDYGYKIVANGAYLLDPANPLTTWVGGVENSRARVADCETPRFDLFDVAATATGFSANVTFVSAEDGAAIAGAGPDVMLDGTPWSGTWDAETRVLALAETSLAPGKHVLEVTASDDEGRDAERLRVPFWVEATPFDWRDAVAYFVLTDRFRNGDLTNDAPVGGVVPAAADWQGGDWAGVLEKIEDDYFTDLGVNVLWISPHVDNPDGGWSGADGRFYAGYHGYWPKSPRQTEEHFGSAAELRAVVDAAHARGMRVLLDLVVNHVHEESAYWTANTGTPWFHAEYVCGFEQPINCWFADYLPDFDFQNSATRDALIADARFWAEETGADGFRVDALKHFEHVVGRTLRVEVAEPEELGGSRFYMVGETFVGQGGQAELLEYISPRELDGQFDFPLYWEILRTVGRSEGTLYDLETVLRTTQGYYPPFAVMGTFAGNHDVARFISHADSPGSWDLYGTGSKDFGWNTPPGQPAGTVPYERLKTAFTILFALPGMPTIYYGDEIGLAGAGDPDNRRAMPWTGVSTAQESVRTHVTALAAARRAMPGLSRGTLQQVWLENDLLVLERRWTDNDGVVRRAYLVINRGATTRTVSPQVTAPDGTYFVDVVGSGATSVTGGSLAISVPAFGSALYVPSP